MIATRQRRKRFPWKRLTLPLLAAALAAAAFVWPPSQNWIASQPIAAPLHFVIQNRTIANQNRQLGSADKQLADAKMQVVDRDRTILSLHAQLARAQREAARPEPKTAPRLPTAASNAPDAPLADLAGGATQDMRRTAQMWGAMDAETAAKVVQHLPLSYVARVFSVMSPDSAGAILENLPPAYAAALTQEHPELRR